MRGRHTFKAGLDFNFQHIDNFFPGNFSGSYTFNSYADFAANRPFSFTQAFAGANTDGPLSTPNVNEYAFYAQDSWRVSEQLTLNYGIRYDFFGLASPKVKNPDPGLAAANLDTSLIPIDKNNVGGRFGFAYRLTQKRQHRAARRRRQLLRAHPQHHDRHGVHAKRNSGADLHADGEPAGVPEHPFGAARR